MNLSSDPRSVPLTRFLRAGHMESVHRGRYVLLQGDRVLASGGDTQHPVFVRSAAKPIQAMVGVTSGAVAKFGLDTRSLAIAIGSHSGTAAHLDAVTRTLEQSGVEARCLQCGGHWSVHAETARAQVLPPGVDQPPALWSNCSGKHAMMLAASRAQGEPLDNYLLQEHATQRAVADAMAALSGLPHDQIFFATDGCGAPAPCLPLEAMAHTLRRLARPDDLPAPWGEAARQVTDAMRAHPELIAGPERFDTDLMVAAKGRVLSKCGAEGVIGIVVPAQELTLVMKVDDGGDRGFQMFVLALLRQLGVLDDATTQVLSDRHGPTVLRNHAGTVVGSAEALIPAL